MVKRPKSPEVVEEARYFTVCQPYPLNANWVFEEDQIECARWVAECIGPNYVWGMHEKPSARGMVLLEISKEFTDHARLLGEHRWSEMLKAPKDEEKPRVSQVFHSFYAKGRDAQKDGWKHIPVKASWFGRDWKPGERGIRHPYPATHWCNVPTEDKTNKPLCRPLPVQEKPPPPAVPPPAPVVGSSKWVDKQNKASPTRSAWAKGPQPLDIGRANQASRPAPKSTSQSPLTALSPQLSKGEGISAVSPRSGNVNGVALAASSPSTGQPSPNPVSPRQKTARAKLIPLKDFVSKGGNQVPNKPWGPDKQPTPTSATESSFSAPSPGPRNAWSKPIKIVPSTSSKKGPPSGGSSPFGFPSSIEVAGSSGSIAPADSDWIVPPSPTKGKDRAAGPTTPRWGDLPDDNRPLSPVARSPDPAKNQSGRHDKTSKGGKARESPPRVTTPTASSHQSQQLNGASDDDDIYVELEGGQLTDIFAPHGQIFTPDAYVSNWESAAAATLGQPVNDRDTGASNDNGHQDLWGDDEDTRRKKAPDLICPTHGIACTKGICRDLSKMVKAEERRKAEEERAKKPKKDKRINGKKPDNKDTKSGLGGGGNGPEADIHGFTPARTRGFGRGKGNAPPQVPEVSEPSHIGRLRAFDDVDAQSVADSNNGWANEWT